MARRSLRPHLNQIRTWVRQGRTDAWIAHQLEVTVQQIEAFKRENELAPDGAEGADAPGVDFDDEIDLRAEDDALIAAELEAAEAARAEEEAEARRRGRPSDEADEADEDEDDDAEDGDARAPPRAPRRPRTRAPRRAAPRPRGHLRPRRGGLRAVARPGRRGRPDLRRALGGPPPVEVTVEEDQIVIRRAGEDDDDDADDDADR